MTTTSDLATTLALLRVPEMPGVVLLPALVRGKLVWPDAPSIEGLGSLRSEPLRLGRTLVHPAESRRGDAAPGALVFPYVQPAQVVERGVGELSASLYATPVAELRVLLTALHDLLDPSGTLVAAVADALRPPARPDGIPWRVAKELVAAVFAPEPALRAVGAELRYGDLPGEALLDGWVEVPDDPRPGPTAVLAGQLFGARPRHRSALRAVPTRQLHITAGNSPLSCAVSTLRALTTKGAATIKCPPEQAWVAVLLSLALASLAPRHAAAQHLSLVYWRGGDREVEDVLLADGSYDRVAVWGGRSAVADVRARTGIRVVAFEPRVGMSLIGREAFDDLDAVAVDAVTDSLVEDQAACTASLVHYVEADADQVDRYSRSLQRVLARWDAAIPSPMPAASRAAWWRLRREDLVGGAWYLNGNWPDVRSSVVHAPHSFDLSAHPGGRCVVVRRVDRLEDALAYLDRSVSTVGIYPQSRWLALRDQVVAQGVSNVSPLGQAERRWPGSPHDGMRVLAELVNFVVA